MKHLLLKCYDFFEARKTLFYVFTVVSFLLLGALASRIKFEEDIAKMMPNSEATAAINDLLSNSSLGNKIVVKIKSANAQPEQLIALADSMVQYLEQNQRANIKTIKLRIEDETALDVYSAINENLPVYLDESDYQTIDSLLTSERVDQTLSDNYSTLTTATGFVMKRMIADDPVGISRIALRKLQHLQLDNAVELYDGYMFTDSMRSLVFFITPAAAANETSQNGLLVSALDDVVSALKQNEAGASIYYYGGSAVAVSNANQLKRDTTLTLTITVVGVLLFITLFFRRKRMPLIMMLPVVFGALLSLTVMTVIKGSISTIAVAAGSIVLGIAVNYSLHFFNHYKHCKDIRQTIVELISPITLGSFTTVASFFALTLLQSHILNDFGLFAGCSLLGAALFTLVYLPHFAPQPYVASSTLLEEKIAATGNVGGKYNWVLVLIILLVTVFLFRHASNVRFESDMASLNYMTPHLRASEKEIAWMQDDTSKTVFVAATGANRQAVLQANEVLLQAISKEKAQGFVTKYGTISEFLPSVQTQQERIQRWNNYWSSERKQALKKLLIGSGKQHKFNASAFNRFFASLDKVYQPVDSTTEQLIEQSIGSEYILTTPTLMAVVNPITFNKATRAQVYARLQQMPNVVVLDKQLITNKFIDVIYSDFNAILTYTFLIVFFALLISYGRLELTLITFLPMLITWIWILGIMSLLGLQFNIINIIISTFIFGLGDDFSIFVTDGLTQKFKYGKPVLGSHKVAIFLCAVTTLLGLGALIFAKHPALQSIAGISIIGILCVVFIGQTIQPFLFNFFIQSRKEKGLAPWTISTLLLAIFAFSYYVFGSLLLTIIGYILLYLVPYPNKKARKRFFHFLVCNCLKSLSYIMMNVRKVHINKESMDFSKPAIIISNHISFLDILVTVMQHPKLILLTNHWVYYSPVFGKVVQLADYYPVMEGVDPAIEKFVDIVNDGYSIVIFPEGTRSVDGRMKRFHKGAFYLAEKLNIDIVPLLLHGTGDTMRKGDFMLFNGQKTMKYLPRITPDNKSFGEGYAERTKNISRYFKAEYELLREQIETPAYYRQKLRMNYIYKGPELEWRAINARKNENYWAVLNNVLPRKGTIVEFGCGYGFTTYMMQYLGWDRTLTAFDVDAEKIDVANNCYAKSERVQFSATDFTEPITQTFDAAIIDAAATGLNDEATINLMQNCMQLLPTGGVLVVKGGAALVRNIQHEEIFKSTFLCRKA